MTDDYRECARGARCHDATRTDTGELRGALTPRAFCDRCAATLRQAVDDLPGLYRELAELLGEKPRTVAEPVTTTRQAPIPLREDVDAAMVHMVDVVTSWEARVRDVAGLPPAPVSRSWGRRADALRRACGILSRYLPALLALPPAPMRRTLSLQDAAALAPGTPGEVFPDAGYVRVQLRLDGAEAGLELLELHRRATGMCGHTRPVVALVGVDCPRCGMMALTRRAGDDGVLCGACRARIPDDEYAAWTFERAEQQRTA